MLDRADIRTVHSADRKQRLQCFNYCVHYDGNLTSELCDSQLNSTTAFRQMLVYSVRVSFV